MGKYRVIGRNAIEGVATGGIVELSDADGERLIAGGHVEAIATRASKSATSPQAKEDD
jgi:hypothetical protein